MGLSFKKIQFFWILGLEDSPYLSLSSTSSLSLSLTSQPFSLSHEPSLSLTHGCTKTPICNIPTKISDSATDSDPRYSPDATERAMMEEASSLAEEASSPERNLLPRTQAHRWPSTLGTELPAPPLRSVMWTLKINFMLNFIFSWCTLVFFECTVPCTGEILLVCEFNNLKIEFILNLLIFCAQTWCSSVHC